MSPEGVAATPSTGSHSVVSPSSPAPEPTPKQPGVQPSAHSHIPTISIKLNSAVKPEPPKLKAEVPPLTQETLEQYWKETVDELGLGNLLGQRKVTLEGRGQFYIEAPGTYFETEFKPHQVAVMQSMREKSGMPMLNCRIMVKRQAHEARAYQPQEKFEAMLGMNPELAGLRKIFDEIDY